MCSFLDWMFSIASLDLSIIPNELFISLMMDHARSVFGENIILNPLSLRPALFVLLSYSCTSNSWAPIGPELAEVWERTCKIL